MATQSQGIQQLLAAERRAAEKVRRWCHGMDHGMVGVMVPWCHGVIMEVMVPWCHEECNTGMCTSCLQTSEARKRKNRRMKQAKEEAMVEIERWVVVMVVMVVMMMVVVMMVGSGDGSDGDDDE